MSDRQERACTECEERAGLLVACAAMREALRHIAFVAEEQKHEWLKKYALASLDALDADAK